jgi:arginyl-tRNA synthetase
MKRLLDEARGLLESLGIAEPRLDFPKKPGFGDVSSAAAFELAKAKGENPAEVAKKIAAAIDVSKTRYIERVEAVGGFVNFYARWDTVAYDILSEALTKGVGYGEIVAGGGRSVLIEHTSVNPNKALHIGHARNVCLGDSLARLYLKTGHKVSVANYIDDSGTQMAEILLAFMYLGYSLDPGASRFDEYCGRVYSEVSRKIEQDPRLSEIRKKISAELENPDSHTFKLNRQVVDRVLRHQLQTCWRLGARYDILNRESDIIVFNLWDEVFERLRQASALYLENEGPKKGCWLIRLAEHPVLGKEGDEVLVKSDGVTTYVGRDIGYAAWKLGLLEADFRWMRWGENPDGTPIYITDRDGGPGPAVSGASLTINVVDVRQRRPQEIVRYALKKLGADPGRYVHFAYEVVSLSKADAERLQVAAVENQEFVQMSGRAGIYVNVDPLLDHVKSKALEEAVKRHPDWPKEKLEEVAEKIAVAALRYFMVRSDPDKMIVFDSEEASDLEGDTGPYIQYAYARACRILEKSGSEPSPKPYSKNLDPAEKELVKTIGMLPLVNENALRLMSVKVVAGYARELAVCFNNFYERCPVLTAEEPVRSFRLGLVEGFRAALTTAAWIVGIPLLTEM